MTAPISESTAQLAAALARVQAELPTLERDRTVEVQQKNGGTYRYSYVTLARLTEAIMPLLAKNGLAFAAMPGVGSDGKMCLRYYLLHDSGERLSGEFPISGEGGIQMVGGRITYARRYCLAALVGVAADEDDEARLADDAVRGTVQRAQPRSGRSVQRAQQSSPAGPPLPSEEGAGMSPEQRAKLMALFGRLGVADRDARMTITSQLVGRQLASANELTTAEAARLIDALERAAEERAADAPDPVAALSEALVDAQGGEAR